MAYKLALPADCPIHPMLYISCLKQKLGAQIVPLSTLPLVDSASLIHPESIAVLQERFKQLRNRTIIEVLIQWQCHAMEDAI